MSNNCSFIEHVIKSIENGDVHVRRPTWGAPGIFRNFTELWYVQFYKSLFRRRPRIKVCRLEGFDYKQVPLTLKEKEDIWKLRHHVDTLIEKQKLKLQQANQARVQRLRTWP